MMLAFLFGPPRQEQGPPLIGAQRALVEKKFEILRQASFGFTQDRLLHIQEEDLERWTDECTGALRRKIVSAAPSNIKIALVDFRKLRCISLQCLALAMPYKAVTVLALVVLLSCAATQTANGEVPTAADFAACNEEAPRAVKAGTAWPIRGDHTRADRARGRGTDVTVIESADPQIHGMEAEGAKNATYQAAYRSCMRRKGF